jgi:hypothetical protein
MNHVILGWQPDILVTTDPIIAAQQLQIQLSAFKPEDQPAMAARGIDMIGDPREICGGRKVWLHTLGAHILAQGLSDDEMLYHGTYFGDVTVRTEFSRIAFVQHRTVQSLCLSLVETNVIASPSNPEFVGENIRSGVFVPVHAIESAFAA